MAEVLGDRLDRHAVLQLADADPEIPEELSDRAADCWEPLLAVADAAGGDWPKRARQAAVELNRARQAADPSLGMLLLADARRAFGEEERLATGELLRRLCAIEEAPRGAMPGRGAGAGKPLDARGLAGWLRPYGIRPKVVRVGEETPRGYARGDFADAWARYLPAPPSATGATSATPLASHVADVADGEADPDPPPLTDADDPTLLDFDGDPERWAS